MMSLNRPKPPTMGEVAPFLSMDRTTLTAALKPLTRQGLVEAEPDKADARARRLALTKKGHAILQQALPIWRDEHDAVDRMLLALEGALDIEQLRDGIGLLGEADRAAVQDPDPKGETK